MSKVGPVAIFNLQQRISLLMNPTPAFPTADPAIGWGEWQPGERLTSLDGLKPGDYLLNTTAFSNGTAHNVVEVLGRTYCRAEPTGLRVRMVEPRAPRHTRANSAEFALAPSELSETSASRYYRAVVPARFARRTAVAA